MAASFPGAIKTFSAVVNGVTKLVAALFNSPYDEITAIETELGTDPAGSAADLKTRLAVSLNADGTLKNSYDSGWFAVAVATAYVKTHNLGTTKFVLSLFFADDGSGTNMFQVGFTDVRADGSSSMGGAIPRLITTTQVTIQTGSNSVAYDLDTDGNGVAKSSGYMRVVMLAL